MTPNKRIPKEVRDAETPEEKKQRYQRNKTEKEKAARKKRREEVANNDTSNRRLSFLTNIFHATGYNMNKVAKLTGTTQQAMSWYFSVKDDCRLSQAEGFLKAIGLSLGVSIVRSDKPGNKINLIEKKFGSNSGVKFTIEGNFADSVKWTNPKMPAYVNDCTKDKRMYFLAVYLPTVGLGITEIMNRSEIDMTSLRYIFVQDDIKISQIFDIAKATGGEIKWEINTL